MFSPRQTEIIVLVGRDGKTYHDVEAELGISRGTLKVQISRIMRKIRSRKKPREALAEAYWRHVGPLADAQEADSQ
jgi:DNA-binding NarL/FixJ family response regulator